MTKMSFFNEKKILEKVAALYFLQKMLKFDILCSPLLQFFQHFGSVHKSSSVQTGSTWAFAAVGEWILNQGCVWNGEWLGKVPGWPNVWQEKNWIIPLQRDCTLQLHFTTPSCSNIHVSATLLRETALQTKQWLHISGDKSNGSHMNLSSRF